MPAVKGKTLWQCNQQVESSLRHLEDYIVALRDLHTPAPVPPEILGDCEMAAHHLRCALAAFKKERDRRKALVEDFHKKLRQPE